jgi:predicted DNA-binding transcriptional regulator YafY
LREDLRTFWVAGIQSLQFVEQTAKRVEEKTLERHLESSYGIFTGTPLHTAHVRFTGVAAMRVRGSEWHPLQQQRPHADGSVDLWVPYSDHRELIMDIMRYGGDATVLGPEALRVEVIKQIKKATENYQHITKEE